MAPGSAQAAWLETATSAAGRLDEDALAGIAIGAQQVASRAHAAGLTAAGQITARAAAADPRIGLEANGRPVRLCRDAQGQISLALMLSGYSAAAWADLGITLTWRLPATGQRWPPGSSTWTGPRPSPRPPAVLSEDTARAVEAKILPEGRAADQPDLQDRLRRLVIAADPDGAERRRQAANGTPTCGCTARWTRPRRSWRTSSRQIEAAAGFARLNALARAARPPDSRARWAGTGPRSCSAC